MTKKLAKNTRGIAMLETAGILVILLVLIIGAFGMIEYMRLSRQLDMAVDKVIYEGAIKPFKFQTNFSSQSSSHIVVDREVLEGYIEKVNQDFISDFVPLFRRFTDSADSSYYIQTKYAEIGINQTNGNSKGINTSISNNNFENGNSSLAEKAGKYVNLDEEFSRMEQLRGPDGESVYALPQGNYSLGNSSNRYLPATFLVGVRVGLDIEDTWIGSALKLFDSEAFLTEHKIVTLRGEISDGN